MVLFNLRLLNYLEIGQSNKFKITLKSKWGILQSKGYHLYIQKCLTKTLITTYRTIFKICH